jgi:hypothetical protein
VGSSGVSASGATISWTTNEASDTQVEFGTTTSYGSSTQLSAAMVTTHNATLGGLAAGTLYHYRVKSRDGAGNLATSGDFVFTTSSGGGTPPPVPGLQNVVWTSAVNCSVSGNTVQKSSGRDDTSDAGAISVQAIALGNGYLEFTVTQTNKLGFCGLTDAPSSTDFNALDFAIKLTGRTVVEVRENNAYKSETALAAGDRFRISVEGSSVKYYRNGTLFYTSQRAPAYPLRAAANFINLSTTVSNAVMSTGSLAAYLEQRSVFTDGFRLEALRPERGWRFKAS